MKKTIILLLLTIILSFTLNASQRYALIIGNSDYERVPLRNPANDANDLANVLENLDFTVTKTTNADQEEMEQTIAEFGNRVGKDDVALFYYSGHGLQVKGSNYLIPLQAAIDDEHDIKYRAVPVSWILDELSVAQMNIFILDACRNNPFKGIRSLDRGLAQINSTPPETFIAFATAPGTVAVDGSGKNSPYTKNLIEQMQKPNIPIEKMFKNVRSNVIEETNNKQTPWENTCLTADFIFCMSGCAKPPTKPEIEVETEYTYDNIKIESNTDGSLYLDGDYVCSIETGIIKTLKNIQTGSHTVKVQTRDDTKKQDVYVRKNRTNSASFDFPTHKDIKISQVSNSPNPMINNTDFNFSLNDNAEVDISIYTPSGGLVKEIQNVPCNIGFNKVRWNGRDAEGDRVENGIYFYKISVNSNMQQKVNKLIVINKNDS